MLIGYDRRHACGGRLDIGGGAVISQDGQIVGSKEWNDCDVGDVEKVEFDLAAWEIIFDDWHAHPGDPEDEPENGTDEAEDSDPDECIPPEVNNKINPDDLIYFPKLTRSGQQTRQR